MYRFLDKVALKFLIKVEPKAANVSLECQVAIKVLRLYICKITFDHIMF